MGEPFDYEALSSGIRPAVKWLHVQGWETCDSGDGSLHAEGMECAFPEPMVVVVVDNRELMHLAADHLYHSFTSFGYEDIDIQAMYNPADQIASILLTGGGLLKLGAPAPEALADALIEDGRAKAMNALGITDQDVMETMPPRPEEER